LPYTLAFAGGAMLFVISDEVIPETHSGDHQRLATFSLVAGFILMTILDTLL
jgi:ZIP family zinc transporter